MTIELGIVVGRFQPVHKGHIRDVIAPACKNSDYVLFLLGSANRSTNTKNPFSAEAREEMIRGVCESLGFHQKTHLKFMGINDYKYSDEKWIQQVQSKVSKAISAIEYVEDSDVRITLYGSQKDSSSYYLELFPQWNLALGDVNQAETYNATEVRNRLFTGDSWQSLVPPTVETWLNVNFVGSELEANMINEYEFINRYKSQFEKPDILSKALEELDIYDMYHANASKKFPRVSKLLRSLHNRNYYKPFFITVDSVVLFRGQVLLIKRGHQPGKGLWALPGGFLNHNEKLLDSAIREVREETKFRLRPEWLVAQQVFDDPNRSLRGRTVTHGFLFKVPHDVPDGTIDHIMQAQFIKGSDDASHAQWVPLAEALENEEFTHHMFEDHSDILYELVQQA
jgi:bifunctional NMN adenylyltransferase/nudix hydrolase